MLIKKIIIDVFYPQPNDIFVLKLISIIINILIMYKPRKCIFQKILMVVTKNQF